MTARHPERRSSSASPSSSRRWPTRALAPVFGYKIEWAGATMLIALGAALGIMVFVLTSGSSDE